MASIPEKAFRMGAESLRDSIASYDKTRISKSRLVSYILHAKGAWMPGENKLYSSHSKANPGMDKKIISNRITRSFIREKHQAFRRPIHSKYQHGYNDGFTYQTFAPGDDEALEVALLSSYKQVFGNLRTMESERPFDLERRLRNGDLCIREFIRGLAKSEFYRKHYVISNNQVRCIELLFKNLLGRPILNKEEFMNYIAMFNEEGFESVVDNLIDSHEYEEAFGTYIVPYQRFWNSTPGGQTSSFTKNSLLSTGFAGSDNTKSTSKSYTACFY